MIKVLAGGRRNEGWVEEVVREYGKRMDKFWKMEWRMVAEDKLSEALAGVGERRGGGAKPYVILLDERGKMVNSPEVAKVVGGKIEEGREVVVVIGGAYGFEPEDRARADMVWSLSPLVFPHQMCRAIVAEQLYRAQEIWAGRPYHHV